jgi:3-oxoacyl-[acyl-carrier-protein] synthase-1
VKPGIGVLNVGMISSLGLNTASSCAAIRCAITGFRESRFMFAGAWILGAEVQLGEVWSGRAKLLKMTVMAIEESLASFRNLNFEEIPLLLCLPELVRPGRLDDLDETFFRGVQDRVGKAFSSDSAVFCSGRIGAAQALEHARRLMSHGVDFCLVVGVDSLLNGETLASLDAARLLLTSKNSDGLIPGEAACAVLLGQVTEPWQPRILGIGFGTEHATMSPEIPLKGLGLAEAISAANNDAEIDFTQLHYRICDANGLQYLFKEASLALARVVRPTKPEFDVWHPADCIGDVGAATLPCILAQAWMALKKEYAPGPGVLCHISSESSERAALVLSAQ